MHINKLLPIIVLAGAAILTTIGIVRAQTPDTVPAVDTEVSTSPSATVTATESTTPTTPTTPLERHQAMFEERAKLLNMSADDLKSELESGKPFYQIAAEHGVTYDTLKANRLSDIKTKLDDMVKVGFMTQDEANQIYAQAQSQPMIDGIGFGHGMR